MRRNIDLFIIFIVTTLAIALYAPFDALNLRWLLFPYIVFVPGYCLLLAVYPRSKPGLIKSVALGLGLNFVIITLMALAQFATEWGSGINPLYIVSGFVFACLIAAYWQRLRPETATTPATNSPKSNQRLYWHFIAIFLILAFVAYQGYALKGATGFSELSVLGSDGMAEGYNTNISYGDSIDLVVTVKNSEYAATNYIFITKFDALITASTEFSLEDQEIWSQPFTFTPAIPGEDQRLDFLLYIDEVTDQPYQETHLWVTVRGE